MTDPARIIAAYDAKEAMADKVRGPDHRAIAEAVAREFGVSTDEVAEIMRGHWVKPMGAG